MDANQKISGYELKGDLARLCLPAANRDPERKLAWVNSICLLFLLVGIIGARQGLIVIKPVPPLQEVIPVVVEPTVLPPQPTLEKKTADEVKPDAQPVAVVLPQMPNINFPVPTIGSLVVSANLASAPPLEPMRAAAQIHAVGSTGAGGDRPQPPYPPIAQDEAEQGTVTLSITSDAAGNVISADVKESSGFPVLDHSATDFVKRHWRLPAGPGNQFFETKIIYQLLQNN
jgi:protein TonB